MLKINKIVYNRNKIVVFSLVMLLILFSMSLLIINSKKTKGISNNTEIGTQSFANRYVGKSDINGLYYAKMKDGKADLYATAYANQILQLLDSKFSNKTYSFILNNRQKDGTFKFGGEGYNDPIYDTYLSYLALEPQKEANKQIEDIIFNYRLEDGSFYYNDASNNSEDQKLLDEKKITYTYMSIYILKSAGTDLNKLASTKEWLKKQIADKNSSHDIVIRTQLVKILNLLEPNASVPANFINSNEIQNSLAKLSQINIDISIINDIESIVTLNSMSVIALPDKDKVNIKERFLMIISSYTDDKQTLYQLLNTYVQLKGDTARREIELLKERILADELSEGGVSNTKYIGTPKETLMTLVILKDNGNLRRDEKLNKTLIGLLENVVSGKETHLDNADIYSLIASIKILNGNILNDEQKSFLLTKMKGYINNDLINTNWRDWFYAVKTLELMQYKFNNTDLPKNYDKLVNNLDNNGFIKILSNEDENEIVNAMILDGLFTITKDITNGEKFRAALEKLADTEKKDQLFLKKRYYASIALLKLGYKPNNIDETLDLTEELKYNDGYKGTAASIDSDIQTTFQVINMKEMKKVQGDDLYR